MKTSACALSEVTGIPLIRLHGDGRPSDQCNKAIHMSAGYRDYAHATLDILNTFHWESIALVFDGKRSFYIFFFLLVHFKHVRNVFSSCSWLFAGGLRILGIPVFYDSIED